MQVINFQPLSRKDAKEFVIVRAAAEERAYRRLERQKQLTKANRRRPTDVELAWSR